MVRAFISFGVVFLLAAQLSVTVLQTANVESLITQVSAWAVLSSEAFAEKIGFGDWIVSGFIL